MFSIVQTVVLFSLELVIMNSLGPPLHFDFSARPKETLLTPQTNTVPEKKKHT